MEEGIYATGLLALYFYTLDFEYLVITGRDLLVLGSSTLA